MAAHSGYLRVCRCAWAEGDPAGQSRALRGTPSACVSAAGACGAGADLAPQGRPRRAPVAATATPATVAAGGHGMVLPVPLIGHRQLPEGKLRSESPAEGMRDWFGLVLGHQPLHVALVGPLSCLVDGV